jgi:hypothetical protein
MLCHAVSASGAGGSVSNRVAVALPHPSVFTAFQIAGVPCARFEYLGTSPAQGRKSWSSGAGSITVARGAASCERERRIGAGGLRVRDLPPLGRLGGNNCGKLSRGKCRRREAELLRGRRTCATCS